MSRLYIIRAEMRLSEPDTEPLHLVPLEPDPLQVFQRVLARVDTVHGERAEVAVDLSPLTPGERLAFRRRQRKAEVDNFADAMRPSRSANWAGLLTSDLTKAGAAQTAAELPRNPAAQGLAWADVAKVERKFTVPTALFYLQILMRTASYQRERARAHMDALMGCWELWFARNEIEMAKIDLKWGYIGSNMPVRRWWFDYRLSTGRFSPWTKRRNARVVGGQEFGAWLTPPASTVPPASAVPPAGAPHEPAPADPVPRPRTHPDRPFPDPTSTAPLPPIDPEAAPDAPDEGPSAGDLLDGFGDDWGLLLYGIGRCGSTVDRMAATMVTTAAAAGAGVVVLEAGEAGRRVGAAAWGGATRVDVPLRAPEPSRPVVGWNPLVPAPAGSPVDRAAVAGRALTAMVRSADERQAAAVIDAAVRSLRVLVQFLPRDLVPTLLQITPLLADAGWRDVVLPVLDAPTRRFWTDVLPGIDPAVVGCVVDLAERLAGDDAAVALLGQPETTYDPYALLAAGATTVLSGGTGPLDEVLAALLWIDATSAARALVEGGPDSAPLLVATEAHRYGGDPEGLFVHDLTATMQAGAKVLLLTERPDLHDARVRRALRDITTVVAVDGIDGGAQAAAEWLGLGDARELRAALDATGPDECLVASARDRWRPRAFDTGGRVPDEPVAADPPRSRVPTGQPLRATRARLDGLDARIAEHLASPPPDRPGGPGPARSTDAVRAGANVVPFDPSRRRRGADS